MISIIVPFYNAEKFLDRCIQSFLCQTYNDWELLLVNDGSSDNSPSVIKPYLEKDHRINLISQKNAGVSSARNKGLSLAKGEFICFCDVDDFYEPYALELMMNHFSNSIDIVKCDFVRDIQGKRIRNLSTFKGLYSKNQILRDVLPEYIAPISLKEEGEFCSIWGCIIRATLLKNKSFIAIEIMEDKVFWLETLLAAQSIFYLATPLYVYNWSPFSAMNSYHKNYIQNVIEVCCAIKKILKGNKLYNDCKNRVCNLHIILFRAIIYNELISRNSIIKSVYEIRKYKEKFLPEIPWEITQNILQVDSKWILMQYNCVFGYFCLCKVEWKLRFWAHKVLEMFKLKVI